MIIQNWSKLCTWSTIFGPNYIFIFKSWSQKILWTKCLIWTKFELSIIRIKISRLLIIRNILIYLSFIFPISTCYLLKGLSENPQESVSSLFLILLYDKEMCILLFFFSYKMCILLRKVLLRLLKKSGFMLGRWWRPWCLLNVWQTYTYHTT